MKFSLHHIYIYVIITIVSIGVYWLEWGNIFQRKFKFEHLSGSSHKRQSSTLPTKVKIVEVGPRDGLQNEKQIVSLDVKIGLINRLALAGLSYIEIGSFVSPKWVPQMADTAQLFQVLNIKQPLTVSALIPNMKGFESAVQADAKEIALIAAASETFSKRNINCTIAESLSKYRVVCEEALLRGISVRGYVSCVYGCPYEGVVEVERVIEVTRELFEMGCYQVSLGDTIGVGSPSKVDSLLLRLIDAELPLSRIAVHFHDTSGTALPNILVALQHGISVIDSSVSGLGGCPYAEGACGNVSTEAVVRILDELGIDTGVDLEKLLEASNYINAVLNDSTQTM